MQRCWVNGRVSEQVAVQERALHYGDGLFETLRVSAGVAQYWPRHHQRLVHGVERLGIRLDLGQLQEEISAFCAGVDDAVLKIIISRGQGGRGYRYEPEMMASRILLLYPRPRYPDSHYRKGVRLRICDTRLSAYSALAGIKHLNRLEQVLARNEWGDDFEEGLMLDSEGRLVEGTMSNLFVVQGDELLTPALVDNGIPGVIRAIILDIAKEQGITCHIDDIPPQIIQDADELFVCNSVIGIWPVRSVGENTLTAPGPLTQQLMTWLENYKQESLT